MSHPILLNESKIMFAFTSAASVEIPSSIVLF